MLSRQKLIEILNVHCDLDAEDSNVVLPHNTWACDALPPYQVYLPDNE